MNAPLWRYLKLSTFFSLIHGSVFIPSLKTLCKGEPKEGFLPFESPSLSNICACIEERRLLEPVEAWLLEKASKEEKFAIEYRKSSPGGYTEVLFQIWLNQLQARRAIWCWHKSDNESMAMWNIYAHQGVAVRSSLASIEKALCLDDDWEVRVGNLKYMRSDWQSNDYLRNDPRLLLHPFMFKSIDYEHEKEVRVFLKINPEPPPFMGKGIEVPIDPIMLIKEVVLSPFIRSDEQAHLKEMFEKAFVGSNIEVRASTGACRRNDDCDFTNSILKPHPCTSLHEAVTDVVRTFVPETSELSRIPFVEEEGLPELLKQL